MTLSLKFTRGNVVLMLCLAKLKEFDPLSVKSSYNVVTRPDLSILYSYIIRILFVDYSYVIE
jgi:hypothetical protein